MPNDTPDTYNQPVAYDANGQPLYAHPPTSSPQVVHIARSSEPIKQQVSDSVKIKHDASKKLYPTLNLSEGEYIISAVRRHIIGLVIPIGTGMIVLILVLSLLINYDIIAQLLGITGAGARATVMTGPVLLFCLLIVIAMYVSYYVYTNNKFFLTNESVIQEIQVSLFSKHEQTVSLGNIEDASYTQKGIIQELLNYGSIRLSTEGDETTYRFSYVAAPKEHIAALNNAVEAFKNGRPVQD